MIHFLSKANPKALRGTALVRLDFNTEDDWRLVAAIPTLKLLLRSAAKIVILSHKGRPKPAILKNGKVLRFDKKTSLRRDAAKLERLIGKRIHFIPHFNFKMIRDEIARAPAKSVFVLENVRFLKGEAEGDIRLARQLARLGDYFVNEAFAVSHRNNASIAGLPKCLKSYAGLELERELKFLSHVLEKPKHPLVLILGGGKAADKLDVIKNLKSKVDLFLLGGAPANTILFLKGMDVKNSVRDRNKKDLKEMREVANYSNLFLPVDFKWKENAILDIGEKTVRIFQEKIKSARTIFWSGPMGLMEKKPYDKGTLEVARAIVRNRKAFTLAGGGETVMFLKKHKLDRKFSFISTGGGAMLEFLAGKKLPGVEALKER